LTNWNTMPVQICERRCKFRVATGMRWVSTSKELSGLCRRASRFCRLESASDGKPQFLPLEPQVRNLLPFFSAHFFDTSSMGQKIMQRFSMGSESWVQEFSCAWIGTHQAHSILLQHFGLVTSSPYYLILLRTNAQIVLRTIPLCTGT